VTHCNKAPVITHIRPVILILVDSIKSAAHSVENEQDSKHGMESVSEKFRILHDEKLCGSCRSCKVAEYSS
jgi:hypothetical protein